MTNMLDIGGTEYIINFGALEDLLNSDPELGAKKMTETDTKEIFNLSGDSIGKEVTTRTYDKGKEIDMTRYEMVRLLFEVVLTFNGEFDDALGMERGLNGAPLPFKLSFNTLINYGVITEIE